VKGISDETFYLFWNEWLSVFASFSLDKQICEFVATFVLIVVFCWVIVAVLWLLKNILLGLWVSVMTVINGIGKFLKWLWFKAYE
jgi:hypothetical protein